MFDNGATHKSWRMIDVCTAVKKNKMHLSMHMRDWVCVSAENLPYQNSKPTYEFRF